MSKDIETVRGFLFGKVVKAEIELHSARIRRSMNAIHESEQKLERTKDAMDAFKRCVFNISGFSRQKENKSPETDSNVLKVESDPESSSKE